MAAGQPAGVETSQGWLAGCIVTQGSDAYKRGSLLYIFSSCMTWPSHIHCVVWGTGRKGGESPYAADDLRTAAGSHLTPMAAMTPGGIVAPTVPPPE